MEAGCEMKKEDLAFLLDSPDWICALGEKKGANQLVVAAGVGLSTAFVSMHEKDDDGIWKVIMTTPGFIGKKGLGKTKEGDFRTPVGAFHFKNAFGILDDPGCSLPYHKVTEDDYWSGDMRDGFAYNQLVSIKDYPDLDTTNSEHLTDYTVHYQYCLSISYNEDGIPGKGSGIFLHCFGPQKPYTVGCVAIPKEDMLTVLKNVREDCVVIIDSLKNLSPETWDAWELS